MIRYFILFLFSHLCQSKGSPPVLIEQPQDMIAELDKPMAIHCRTELSSLDDLHIDWYKDGRLVTTDPNARIITEFMALHIINTMPQDAGVYHCIARNSHGQTQSRKARIQFLKLDKEFPISPTSTSALMGESVRLRCQPPYGSPAPIVYWTKDGKNLSMPLDHYDLILPSVQKSDFGAYRCMASNGLVRQSSIAYLTEFHRPTITILPSSSSRIDLRRGQSIHLECHIDNEQYKIEWHFGNKVIQNPNIHITSIEFNQSGTYKCVGRYEKYKFYEEILLAVHDIEISNGEEIVFSETTLNVVLGRPTIIECLLPLNIENKVSWLIVNSSDVDNIKFDYDDNDQYRLKINRIREFYHNIIFKCYYQNKNKKSYGLIKLNVEQIEPPPIIFYVPNNQTVPIGAEAIFSCQSDNDVNVQWWFTQYYRPHKTIRINHNNLKYRVEKSNDLIIQPVEKSDAGVYKCIAINKNNEETIWTAHLNVDDIRSNAKFHRIERKDLPQAPSQPIAIDVHSHSIELVWNIQSNDIVDYLIEYYEVNSDKNNFEWKRLITKSKNSRQIINNLKSDSIYQFMIRAKNSFGYGPPSMLSELIETKPNQQSNDEIIYLHDPSTIQETSATIKWDVLHKNSLINQILIYIINKKENHERIETITNSLTTHTIHHLRPDTEYSIYLVPITDKRSYSSNTITFRTLESIPSSSPRNVVVRLVSTTELSIRWDPPLDNETNGQIIAYKVNCLASNETNSKRLTNISSDAKGLYIKSLIENMEYCISIAARTRIGYGPYSQPICVIMNEKFLQLNQNSFKYRLHEFITQTWFLSIVIVSSALFTCAFAYFMWLCYHNMSRQHRHRIKFSSSPSISNQSVELPIQKTVNNGKRYDLIQDTSTHMPSSSTALWMNSMPNGMRLQCCTTTTASASSNSEHYSMNIHKNPINALLNESRQQQQLNPYATTGIFQQTTGPGLPSYSETVYSPPPSSHHSLPDQQQQQQQQQQIASPSSPTVQYQPPWLDHHPSSTLQYHSESRTSFSPYHCVHCISQSNPHTPAAAAAVGTRPLIQSSSNHLQNNSSIMKTSTVNNNESNKTSVNSSPQILMDDSPSVTHQSNHSSRIQTSNGMMLNSFEGETLTTSWVSSSIDDNNHESTSSSSTDKYEYGNSIEKQHHSSSEGSIFSDTDVQQMDETNGLTSANFERTPTFLIPNI